MAGLTLTAGENLDKDVAVYIKATDGKAYKADITDSTKAYQFLTSESKGADESILMYEYGYHIDAGWAWTIGPIYLSSTAGVLTQTKPSGANYRQQIVAMAVSATAMNVLPPDTEAGAVNISNSGTNAGHRQTINLIPGSGIGISTSDNASTNAVDATISATGASSGVESIYSVKSSPAGSSYNATGDGVADDTAKIQGTINWMAANSPPGGVLWFPKGTYKTTSVLTLYSNIELRGAGNGISLIYSAHTGTAISAISKSNIKIVDIGIYSTDNTSASLVGIYLQSNNNVVIENCEISYIRQYGIYCESGVNTNVTISNNYLHHIHTTNHGTIGDAVGIVAHYLLNSKIEGNYFYLVGAQQQTDHAIYGGRSTNKVIIRGNFFNANPGGNIQIHNADASINDSIIIDGNIFTACYYWGIILNYTSNAKVINNIIHVTGTQSTNKKPGIELYGGNHTNFIVSGNKITSTVERANGLLIVTGTRGVVTGNQIIGDATTSTRGINCGYDGAAADIAITNNYIYNVYSGIKLEAATAKIQISNNTVEDSTSFGRLESGSDYVLYKDNLLVGTGAISDGGAGHLTNTGNVSW